MDYVRPEVRELRDLLNDVRRLAGPSFSGVGVIVADELERLPLIPLRDDSAVPERDAAEVLAGLSRWEHDGHDGFHVLTPDLRLQLVSQYLLPTASPGLVVDRSKPIGGRYLAAQLGSAMPGVRLTGVVSSRLGISVFANGAEELHEAGS